MLAELQEAAKKLTGSVGRFYFNETLLEAGGELASTRLIPRVGNFPHRASVVGSLAEQGCVDGSDIVVLIETSAVIGRQETGHLL